MKYKVLYNMEEFYPKYINGSIDAWKLSQLMNKTIGSKITPNEQRHLSNLFKATDSVAIAIFGLSIGFIDEVVRNNFIMRKISLYELGLIRSDVISRIKLNQGMDITGMEIAMACISTNVEVAAGVLLIKEIEKMTIDIRQSWISYVTRAITYICMEMINSPEAFSPHYVVDLINHPEGSLIFSQIINKSDFTKVFEKNEEALRDLHEESGGENSDVPIEILAKLNGLIN